MAISNEIFEHFRNEQKKVDEAILFLKEKGYKIYKTEVNEKEVV